jgi:hypothetical protein
MTGGNSSGRSIYYTEDQILDLNDVISANNKSIKLPNDFVINGNLFLTILIYLKLRYSMRVQLSAHWLAIEGVQPSVPENPQLLSRELQKKEAVEGVVNSFFFD